MAKPRRYRKLVNLTSEEKRLIANFDQLPDSQLVSTEVAAAILGVTKGTMEVWRSTGRHDIEFIKLGSLVRYPVGVLRARAKSSRIHTDQSATKEIS